MLSLLFIGLGASNTAHAQSQNEVQVSVLFDGASNFTAGEPTAPTGNAPEPHVAGTDGGPQNLVVRTHDQFAVRVDWNINEVLATGVTLTTVLPLSTSEWTTDDTGGYAGCVTTTFPDPQTAVCLLGDQPEGSNGTIRMTAALNEAIIGESTDGTTFDVPTTLTTGEDPAGVDDSLDQFLTISESPIASFRKGAADVAGPFTSGGEDGYVFLYPLSLIDFSQGPNPIIGAGPINSASPIDFFDHAYMLVASAAIATTQQMIDAGVGFVGRSVCGAYDGTGAFPLTAGTWTCAPTLTSPTGYPVVPINIVGHDAPAAPAVNADQSPNVVGSGVNVLTGQIAFWLPADEVDAEIANPINGGANNTAQFENAIAGQDETAVITDQAEVQPIQIPGAGGVFDEQASTSDPADDPTENTSRTTLGASPPTTPGPGATIGHHIMFRGGPLQLLETTLYDGGPRLGLDYRTTANGGLRGLLPGEQVAPANSNGDSIGNTPRGNVVTINSQVLSLSTNPASTFDAPIQGCTAFDTTHYQLTEFGSIAVTQTDGTGSNTNPTVVGGFAINSNTGPLAHVDTGSARTLQAGLGGQQNAVGGFRAGLDYTVEFATTAPQVVGTAFGVEDDALTCNDDQAINPGGWIDATDAAALAAAFDLDANGDYEGINRARVRITQRFPWARGPGGADDNYVGFQAYFQARVLADLDVQTVNQELFALQSHSFGDLGANGVPDNVPQIGFAVTANACRPYSSTQWIATGNDLATPTGYCNNTFIDDGIDSLDTNDSVDWDNNSTTRSTLAASGLTTFLNSSGAVIRIVAADLALSKTNNDGLADIADNGDLVRFTLTPRVVGSGLEALTNVRLTDNLALAENYNFVQFISGPNSPGATCNPPATPGGTITCQFSEPNPAVDTGPLPPGLPGGWSDEVVIEVVVVGAVADAETPTVITNTASLNSTALGPWDSDAEVFTATPTVSTRARISSASSFLPLPADEGVIVKVVNELEGACEVVPQEFLDTGGTLADWQARCSMVVANEEMSFDLSVTNEGNTAFTRLEFIDVFPHLGDDTDPEPFSDTSVGQLISSRPPTVGDGRLPASDFVGDVAFVSLTPETIPAGSSLAAVWVTVDDPLTVSRDPNLALTATTWCDGVAGAVVSGPAGACPTTPEAVTAVYGLIEGGVGLLPGETATLNLTLDSIDTGCADIWTNTFGLRMDEIFLPIRSNDVSVMVTGCDLADLEDTYSTLITSGGPVHPVRDGLALGIDVDAELDGQIGLIRALGDDDNFGGDTLITDDEDALTNVVASALITGQTPLAVADANGIPTSTYTLNIPVVNTTGADAFVVGYIDFNGDGDFDTTEASAPVTVATSGDIDLTFPVSGIASGITGVRLRLSSVLADVNTPIGFATDGEVEDHLIEILPVIRTAKVLVPANAPDTFDLSAGISTVTGGNGAATEYVPFIPGAASTITIMETANSANPFVTSAVCTDADGIPVSPPSNGVTTFDTSIVTLNGNSTSQSIITCTFTNTQQTTIAVVKTATPADDTNFNFTSSVLIDGAANSGSGVIPLSFELDGELVDSDSDQFINQISTQGNFTGIVNPVTFTETVPEGWLLRSVSCNDVDTNAAVTPVTGVVAPGGLSGSVAVDINEGDTITCTFDNIQLVSLGSQLWIDTNGDGDFDANEPPIVGATVNLLDELGSPVLDANGAPITTITDASGNYFFNGLLPGNYRVQVVVGSTLSPTPIQSSDPNDDVNNDSNVDIASPLNDPATGTFTSGVISLTPGTEPSEGDDDQAGQTDVDDDVGNMTLDLGFIPEPEIGVSKAAGVPTLNDNGTFDVVYTLLVQNTGEVDINSITLADNLSAQFGAAFFTASDASTLSGGIVAAPVVTLATEAPGTDAVLPTGNTAYSGNAAGVNVFTTDASTLGLGDIIQVQFTVRFNPAVAGQTLNNTATAGGADPSGRLAEDLSNDGSDAATNAGGPGTPTPVIFPLPAPELGVSKAAGTPTLNTDGTYDVPYTLLVQNTGNVDLTNITLVDDLEAQFTAAFFTGSPTTVTTNGIIVAPAVVPLTDEAGTVLVPPTGNAAYSGSDALDDNVFDGTISTLGVGDIIEVTFTVKLNPAAAGETLNNTATVGGTDPLGNPVVDDSNDGSDPTDGAGGPGVPTPVVLPVLDSSLLIGKSLAGPPVDLGDGSFQVTYNFVVENDGNVDLTDLQVVDDLTAMINNPNPNGGSAANAVVSYVSGTVLTPNPDYTGTGVNEMLTGTDVYPVGSVTDLSLTFVFTPDVYFGPFNNTAVVSGTDPLGVTIEDNSENAAVASAQDPDEDIQSPTPFSLGLDATTPITFGWINITDNLNGSALIEWQTVTEVGNAGFNLLVLQESGEWLPVNASLIESQGDSTSPQDYEYLSERVGEEFMLVDVSVTGVEIQHGPFKLNESSGTYAVPKVIEWERIQQESDSKQKQREEQLRQELQDRLSGQRRSGGLLQAVAGALLSVMLPSAHAVDLVSFEVESAGLYQVTHQDLMATGLDLRGIALSRLGLEEASVLWPMDKIQNSGAVFTSNTRLLFPARGLDSLYAGMNKYTLVLDEGSLDINQDSTALPGNEVALAYSYLAEATYAPQNTYSHLSPEEEDSWFADSLNAVNSSAQKSVTLSVDGYVAPLSFSSGFGAQIQRQETLNPELEVSLWGSSALPGNGVTNPDHHVLLTLNGESLEDVNFDGLSLNLEQAPLVSVVEGDNVVNITVPNDRGYLYDLIRLDHVTLRYPRTFDAQQNALVFESNWSKFRVSNLNTNNASVVRLAEDGTAYYMTERGDGQCDTGCVYFSGDGSSSNSYFVATAAGLKTPDISVAVDGSNLASDTANLIIISHPDFINTSSQSLEGYASEVTAQYGSVDIVDVEVIYAAYSGGVVDAYAIKSYISDSYANRETRHILLVGGDNYDYQDFTESGAKSFIPSIYQPISNNIKAVPSDSSYVLVDDDLSPDLTISRLPVRSSKDLDNLIAKRQNYLARNYQNSVLMVADEVDNSNYSFKASVQNLISDHFSTNNVSEVYLDDMDIAEARSSVVSAINGGVSFASYFGHSSTGRWSISSILSGNDVANLINSQRPTVVAQWGCWNTFYVSPEFDSMAHRFLLEGTQGAVTVMGASSFTKADAERRMAEHLSANLQQGMRIGDAVKDAKQKIFNETPFQIDVLLGWAVLGFDDMAVFE